MKNPESPGLYLHVPFCARKCPYCDFYSIASRALAPDWLEAAAAEMAMRRERFGAFDTVYIGGGTPSVLDEDAIERLFDDIYRTFSLEAGPEITIEANPDDVTPARLAQWRELGVNRVSLGVQSFDDGELRFLKRRHTARRALEAIDDIRAAGFTNLGIDLIFGFAGQTATSWARTLRRAIAAAPEHLSSYQMTIEPHTPFGRLRAKGMLAEPDEETQRRFFLAASEKLRAAGYLHYEVSNFARGEELRSRHNGKYWRHAPYLGIGPSAHSFTDGERWWNVRSVKRYCESLAAASLPVEGSETLGEEELALEALFLGFRTREGAPLSLLSRYPRWKESLGGLVDRGLVTLAGDRACPTIEGFLVADQLPLLFADAPPVRSVGDERRRDARPENGRR